MKTTRLSSASTAKLVRMNRKMRFMNLFFGETIRNMVTRQSNGRDVPIQFQGVRLGSGPAIPARMSALRTRMAICL